MIMTMRRARRLKRWTSTARSTMFVTCATTIVGKRRTSTSTPAPASTSAARIMPHPHSSPTMMIIDVVMRRRVLVIVMPRSCLVMM
mmetsp:Transcript_9879/g.12836  ORF Transcript_9879/g.12836 Transcript_9879/m.12836 type:complete len:86 (-) Transcript_9879:168-425(-)